jgi:Leucine-rich repeat (LRR) protein
MLEKLDLSHNSFGGEFPQELVKCTNLTFLDLSFNGLNGKIPDSIGTLPI